MSLTYEQSSTPAPLSGARDEKKKQKKKGERRSERSGVCPDWAAYAMSLERTFQAEPGADPKFIADVSTQPWPFVKPRRTLYNMYFLWNPVPLPGRQMTTGKHYTGWGKVSVAFDMQVFSALLKSFALFYFCGSSVTVSSYLIYLSLFHFSIISCLLFSYCSLA